MKKISISLACMALPVLMSAAEYYVVPGLKASGKDGSSWENALTMYDIFANDAATKKKESESIYKHGDVFYLAGDTSTRFSAARPAATTCASATDIHL